MGGQGSVFEGSGARTPSRRVARALTRARSIGELNPAASSHAGGVAPATDHRDTATREHLVGEPLCVRFRAAVGLACGRRGTAKHRLLLHRRALHHRRGRRHCLHLLPSLGALAFGADCFFFIALGCGVVRVGRSSSGGRCLTGVLAAPSAASAPLSTALLRRLISRALSGVDDNLTRGRFGLFGAALASLGPGRQLWGRVR